MKKTDVINYTAEVEALEKGIAAEKQKITDLRAKLSLTCEEKAQAEKVQQELAYLAETSDDPEARRKLEQAEETAARTDKRVHSLEIALGRPRRA